MNTKVQIACVIDRSGSMHRLASDVIGGFNSFLADQKALEGEADLAVYLFDSQVTRTYIGPLADADELSADTYTCAGGTALYDAIGLALHELEMKAPERAILCVQTDGQENASRECKLHEVRKAIERAQERGWQVLFMGEGLEAAKQGGDLGVLASTTVAYEGTLTRSAFASTMNTATASYRGAK